MSDKYCIASGSYDDPAIWSATDGGSGGAPVPASGDTIKLTRPVEITNYNTNSAAISLEILNGVTADIHLANELGFRTGGDSHVLIDGNLNIHFDGWFHTVYYGSVRMDITEGSVLACVNPQSGTLTFEPGTSLNNRGRIVDVSVFLNARTATASRSAPSWIGTVESRRSSPRFQPQKIGAGSFSSAICGRCHIRHIWFTNNETDAGIYEIDLGSTEITVTDSLRFPHVTPDTIRVLQSGSVTLLGDILGSGLSAEWIQDAGARSTFSGTADQTIAMPPGVTGQTWNVDKPAGTLDLTNFDGFLQGRVRNLIVRPSSSIDLSGQAPYLATEVDDWASYEGIRADYSSRGGSRDVADLLRESLDFCDNYGRIVIPSGKTLLAKSFNNRTGARVSGEGTLLVRYGGLVDSGTIDPSIDIRYYDYPISALLLVLTLAFFGVEFYVTTEGSVGKLFRIDWGDTTFSESETVGMWSHIYTYDPNVTQRTIRLTVTNEDGSIAISTKTVPIAQHPLSVAFSLSPDTGAPPLTVTATVATPFGKLFTYDWGNGHVTEATESKTESYTYLEPGFYEVTVVATNDENVSMSTSRPVTVTAVPAVEFSLSPVRGIPPLAVTATVTSDFGELFTYDWGDGRTTGPTASKTEQTTYDVAGFHTVTITATNAVGVSTQSARTVDVLSYSAVDQPETGRFYQYDGARPACGIPRAGMPWPYRYALAQGECYMSDTLQLFCPMNESGRALQNGSGLYLARVTRADGGALDPLEIESARYTVFRLDDSDASVRIPVEGHVDVALDADGILLSECLVDENWVFDALGYNFHHVPDDSTHSPFPVAGRNYLVAYELRLKNEIPKVQLQFRVRVV